MQESATRKSKQLLKYLSIDVGIIWFTDENISCHTKKQNGPLSLPAATKKDVVAKSACAHRIHIQSVAYSICQRVKSGG